MPRKIGTENWRKKRRQEHLEMKEYRYYIFCEGEQTEPRYFSGFKKLIEDNPIYRDMVLIQIEPCGAETMRVIGQAERYVKENQITKGQIWCVYDKDSFPAQNFNGVVSRAESLNKENPLCFILLTTRRTIIGRNTYAFSMKDTLSWDWASIRKTPPTRSIF